MKNIYTFLIGIVIIVSFNLSIDAQTFSPAQGATGVSTSPTLTITFTPGSTVTFGNSKNIYVAISDWSSYFTFSTGATPVPPRAPELSVSGNVLTIDLTGQTLNTSTEYLVYTDAGAILVDGVAWDNLTDDTYWRFTTAAPVPQPVYSPLQGATGVSQSPTMTLTFDVSSTVTFGTSKNIYVAKSDWSTYTQMSTGKVPPPPPADARLSVSGNVLTIDFSGETLDPGTEYLVYTDAGAILVDGVAWDVLTDDTQWRFTTATLEAPTLDPVNGATNVSRTPTLTATFSNNIAFADDDYVTVFNTASPSTSPINLYTGTGPFYNDRDSRLTVNGASFTIDFSNTILDGNIQYGVYVPTGVLTVSGTPYNGFSDVNNPGWAFTTATNLPEPTVQTYDPAQGATGVSIKKTLNLTFDMNIQANQGSTVTYLKLFKTGDATPKIICEIDNGVIEPNKGVSIANNVLTIDPTFDLEIDADYYVTIDAGTVESSFGAPFAGIDNSTTIWTFHTEVPPTITTFDPLNDATEVAIDKVINITFDKNIAPNPSANFYYIKILDKSDDSEFLSISVRNGAFEAGKGASINNNILTIDSPSDFAASKTYYMTIDFGAIQGTDGTVFGGIDNTVSNYYQFSTVTNPPAVVTFDPLQDAIEVPINKVLSIDFDKNIQANSGTSNKYLYLYEAGNASFIYQYTFQGGGISPSGITISGTTMTIDFPADLDLNVDYYITIDAGAIEAASTGDPFGGIDNSVSNNWRFKTIAPPEWTVDYPRIENQGESSLDLLGQTEKAGNYYYVVTRSTTAPTEAQIVAGQDENGATALISGNGSMTANTQFSSTLDITGLTINLNHYIYVVSQESAYSLYSTIEQLNFQRDILNTWTGSVSNVFNEPGNWSATYVNSGSMYVPQTASNYPLLDATIEVNNIEVEAGAQLTVGTSGNITVLGSLDLYSTSTQNASFINNGTFTINSDKVRIHQAVSTSTRNYYVSSPVAGATQNSIGADLGMYYWDNPTGNWMLASPTAAMVPTTGYVLRSNNSLVFTGAINNGIQTATVSRSISGLGWNLIGNPYPSAVDWTSAGFTKTNVVDAFWIYLNDQDKYGVYNTPGGTAVNITNPQIPSNHCFWVKVPSPNTTGDVRFTNNVRVHNNTSYLKNATLSTNPTLKIAGVNGTYRDEIAILFNENATIDFDEYDSEKKFSSNTNYIQFFTTSEDKDVCINGYPLYTNDFTVPLSFKADQTGTFSIEKIDYSNFPGNHTVILEDLVENKTVDLIADGNYTFNVSSAGTITDRFLLTFKGDFATAIDYDNKVLKSQIFGFKKSIIIKSKDLKDARYKIFNIKGQLIKEGLTVPNSRTEVNIGTGGIFIVKVIHSNGVESEKVILN